MAPEGSRTPGVGSLTRMRESDPTPAAPWRARPPVWALWVIAQVIGLAVAAVAGAAGAATPAGPARPAGSWTVYHGDPEGSGVAGSVAAVDTSARAWTSPRLDGELYGEPLVALGRVYVATENDTVYSLSSATGAVVWSTHLASPVPASLLPCGDIRPTVGITGTPVIDTARREIFVVADELVDGKASHVVVGLSTDTGKLEMSQAVDPAGADPLALLQRTGLALDQGRVVFGFGGNDGDCAPYRGRVVSEAETGGAPAVFTVDGAAGQSQGAIWMGGAAPAVDADGNVWVEAGNGSVTSDTRPYDDSDSVLELSPSLRLEQYFAPASWPADNADDLDMSTEPALLGDGGVVAAGKSRIAYLLDGSRLGGIGGQQAASRRSAATDVDGGVAWVGTSVFLPCLSGIIAVRADESPRLAPSAVEFGNGRRPADRGRRTGLDHQPRPAPCTASIRPPVPPVSRRRSACRPTTSRPPAWGTASCWPATTDQVVAFAASSTGAPTTTRPSTTVTTPPSRPTPTPPTVPSTDAGISAAGTAAIVVGGLAVIGVTAWLGWWLRRRRTGRADSPADR